MRISLLIFALFFLPLDTNRVYQDTRSIVTDRELMQRSLEIYVLYNQEMAILTSIQSEGVK
jgi:hypothetical protein